MIKTFELKITQYTKHLFSLSGCHFTKSIVVIETSAELHITNYDEDKMIRFINGLDSDLLLTVHS